MSRTKCAKCGETACNNPLKPALEIGTRRYCQECYMNSDKIEVVLCGSYLNDGAHGVHRKKSREAHRKGNAMRSQGFTTQYVRTGSRPCFKRTHIIAYRFIE